MSAGLTILVVEDDIDLQELIALAGKTRAYRVALAGNGLEAKKRFEDGAAPDLVILDINMPGMDGFAFCRWLREDHPLLPVIFLSARAEEYDKIVALEIGGDDYLTKPFSMKELFARVGVGIRRMELMRGRGPDTVHGDVMDDDVMDDDGSSRAAAIGGAAPGKADRDRVRAEVLSRNGITIDVERWSCEYLGQNVFLTVSEFRILRALLGNPGIVVNRDRLASAAFPDDLYNPGRSIDVHICRIRAKLQRIDPSFAAIETVYQVGYRWKD